MRDVSQRERLWFSTVIEAVFVKGLGDQLDGSLRADLKRVGIDLDKLQPAYPIETVNRAFDLVLPRLYPGKTRDEGLFELGRSSLRGYTQTLVGQALIQVLRLIGVRRSLLRMHTSMRGGNNYLQTSSRVVSENCVELTFSDMSGMPAFYRGVIEEGGRLAHARNLRLTMLPCNEPAAIFQVEWDD